MIGLKHLRLALNKSQVQVAEEAGITVAYYNMLEVGKRQNPTQPVILALAKALHCSIDDLYREEPANG